MITGKSLLVPTIVLGASIANDQELHAMLERIRRFHGQVAHLRIAEANPTNFRLSVSGVLAEIDRMQLEVREYLIGSTRFGIQVETPAEFLRSLGVKS